MFMLNYVDLPLFSGFERTMPKSNRPVVVWLMNYKRGTGTNFGPLYDKATLKKEDLWSELLNIMPPAKHSNAWVENYVRANCHEDETPASQTGCLSLVLGLYICKLHDLWEFCRFGQGPFILGGLRFAKIGQQPNYIKLATTTATYRTEDVSCMFVIYHHRWTSLVRFPTTAGVNGYVYLCS